MRLHPGNLSQTLKSNRINLGCSKRIRFLSSRKIFVFSFIKIKHQLSLLIPYSKPKRLYSSSYALILLSKDRGWKLFFRSIVLLLGRCASFAHSARGVEILYRPYPDDNQYTISLIRCWPPTWEHREGLSGQGSLNVIRMHTLICSNKSSVSAASTISFLHIQTQINYAHGRPLCRPALVSVL